MSYGKHQLLGETHYIHNKHGVESNRVRDKWLFIMNIIGVQFIECAINIYSN